MLTIDNLTIIKNEQVIFRNLGFSAGLGSCILLVGKNGAGKTTLLRSISGLLKPSYGQILWNNDNINNFFDEFTSDINYIGHKNFLKPKLTVWQNMEFFAKLNETEILLPSAIRYFALEEVLETPIYQLSSGWQKKILLSKLLYQPKTLWLLDEPTVNLDLDSKKILFNLISTRVKEGGLAIIATHDKMLFDLGSKININDFQ